MRVLERAAPGVGFGVLFGLLETTEVLSRQKTISLPNFGLLVLYAVLTQTLVFSILFFILPRKLTSLFRGRRSKAILTAVILIAAVFLGFHVRLPSHPSITAKANPDKPNIVLISVDTLRRDHVGCYGYAKARTPNIDRLAKESVLFEDATSPIPLTGPSHITMLTGDYPTTHGVGANGVRIGGGIKTMPETLRKSGYRTAAFVSGWTLKNESVGLAGRFDFYSEEFGLYRYLPDVVLELSIPHFAAKYLARFTGYELRQLDRPGEQTTAAALAWMTEADKQPFFALVHYFDPHGPHVSPTFNRALTPKPVFDYRKPEPERLNMIKDPELMRKAIQAYDEEINYADAQVGNLVRQIDQLTRKTIVIFTADHGESLTEHGYYFDHGEFLYETCVRVPLMIRFPDRSFANTRTATQVSLVDLAPTILELATVPPGVHMDGKSILQVLNGGNSSRDSYGAIRQGKGAARRARYYVRSGGFKLIWNYDFRLAYAKPQSEELFDLRADPAEEQNRTGMLPEIQNELRTKLIQFVSRDTNMKVLPDESVIEQLKSLGYTD